MVCPWPIGSGQSAYASARACGGTNSCRGTVRMACSTAGSVMPRPAICSSTMRTRAASGPAAPCRPPPGAAQAVIRPSSVTATTAATTRGIPCAIRPHSMPSPRSPGTRHASGGMAVALAASTMASVPLEVGWEMRHDWRAALTMHDDDIAQLLAEVERLRAEIRDLYQSTSWKVTAPMRGIKNAGLRLRSAFRRTIDGTVPSSQLASEITAIPSSGSLDFGVPVAAARGRDSFGVRRPLEPPAGTARDVRCATIEEESLARIAALPELERWLERDTIPIPATVDRECYYDDRHFEYWLSGIDDCLKIQAACPEVPWTGARLLDFGGATGRVSRHFYLQGNLSEVTLCDVNINNISRVLEHFPSDFGAFKNSWVPSLPLPSEHFDVVIAFSVFTHMNEYELAWLYELRRVLRPGGILYVTVQNEDTWRILPSTVLYDRVKDFESFRVAWQQGGQLADRLVVEYSDEVVHNCSTFHPNTYVRRIWGRVFTVLDIQPLRHAFQSAVILRKDARAAR